MLAGMVFGFCLMPWLRFVSACVVSFRMNMVNGVMKPMLQGQPGLLEPSLHFIVTQTTLHLAAVNLLIAVVQILLGLGFLLLSDRRVEDLVIASFVWALVVWFAGEGLRMLLTGTSSILSGAPGAVLLYPLLGLAVWPRKQEVASKEEVVRNGDDGPLLDPSLASYRDWRWRLRLDPLADDVQAILTDNGGSASRP